MAERALEKIFIRDLHLRCIIGINDEERRKKQDVVIQIVMHVDVKKACRSDRIGDTVDYKAIKNRVVGLVEGSSFFLLEALADAISATCFDDPLVRRAVVTVDKPGALRFANSVGIEVDRRRPGAPEPS
jgi:FolB domain-containing protein